jgi:hypothetical protein
LNDRISAPILVGRHAGIKIPDIIVASIRTFDYVKLVELVETLFFLLQKTAETAIPRRADHAFMDFLIHVGVGVYRV